MKYISEYGAIVDRDGNLINIIEGNPGMVVFPQDLLYLLHKKSPGSAFLLAHTHPPGMTQLSGEDISTLKAQALWMYPFPARMCTITEIFTDYFQETIFMGYWESKDKWLERKELDPEAKRIFTKIQVGENFIDTKDLNGPEVFDYRNILIQKSYIL
jgi:hypothetical protein